MEAAQGPQPPIDALDELALSDPRRTVASALEAARELLDMEIAYFSGFTEGTQVIESVVGDSSSFGFRPGDAFPLEDTYCRRMVAGLIPNLIRDAKNDEHVGHLPGTHDSDMGSYVGVPLRLHDGRIYGTLCCASHQPSHNLDDRDVRFMRVLARVLADHLELEAPPAKLEVVPAEEEDPHEGMVASLSLWFAGAPNAAAAARAALTALEDHLDPDCLHDLCLVVTELVSNSVRHSGIGPASSVGLDVRVRAERVRVEVTDPGSGFEPQVRPPTPDDLDRTGGWGLFLVDELTEGWGVLQDGLTRVWFEMNLRG
jgi:anti-sigma regulatory factor (Ser/Thr protein kinase)